MHYNRQQNPYLGNPIIWKADLHKSKLMQLAIVLYSKPATYPFSFSLRMIVASYLLVGIDTKIFVQFLHI